MSSIAIRAGSRRLRNDGRPAYTEIRMALDAGMTSAVVLSGETTAEDLAAETEETLPDYTLERIDKLVPPRLWELGG
jgi:ribonucleotide monophosphatase NagD (HAD superfamily)